jgi:hypothetical protein
MNMQFGFGNSTVTIYLEVYADFRATSHGLRLSPPGTAATVCRVVPAQMVDDECGAIGGMGIGTGK